MKTTNINIRVDNLNCIKCGKCTKVCPANVLKQNKKRCQIEVEHIDSCIACGHCTFVCPTQSIQHNQFPKEKNKKIDYTNIPSPEQVMLLIKSRRSNRTITNKPIPDETLNLIVEAAKHAPTASNNREVHIQIITDQETIQEISRLTIKTFDSILRILNLTPIRWILKPFLKETYDMIPAFNRYKQQQIDGGDPITRNATAIITFQSPQKNEFGCQDANLAYQNASLMAQSLGISQIYMGFIIRAIKIGNRRKFTKLLQNNSKIHAIMALGIPAFKYERYSENKN